MRRYILLAISLFTAAVRADETITVAAAANLTYVLTPLDAVFEKANPGTKIQVSLGASGNLYAQITHGAPFDVFLAADTDFPKKLVAAGYAGDVPRTFVRGRLVLWTASSTLPLVDITRAVRSPEVKHLAIAEPRTAPYGAAAQAALASLGLTADAQPKLVIGESISQALQFVASGNADCGFVALSLVLSPTLKGKGNWIEVPQTLYPPLDQAEVVTKAGAANPLSKRYADFLLSPQAQAIFKDFGYSAP